MILIKEANSERTNDLLPSVKLLFENILIHTKLLIHKEDIWHETQINRYLGHNSSKVLLVATIYYYYIVFNYYYIIIL